MRVRPVLVTPDEPRLPQLFLLNCWSRIIMTYSDRDFTRRSQNSTPPPADLVMVDRQTLKKVLRILSQSVDVLAMANHCDILLYSLDNYLLEGKNVNINKSMVLLRHYLDLVPECLTEVGEKLVEAHDLMKVILEATK